MTAIEPFKYPKLKHKRSQKPAQYVTNKSYKKVLQKEFNGKCVYCQFPDSVLGSEVFHVEHYLPKMPFKSLEWEYDNLFYSCHICNTNKGNYFANQNAIKRKEIVVNPCDFAMNDHLKYDREIVISKTAEGNWTNDLLKLNNPSRVERRNTIITSIESNLEREKYIEAKLPELKKKNASSNEIETLENALQKIKKALNGLGHIK